MLKILHFYVRKFIHFCQISKHTVYEIHKVCPSGIIIGFIGKKVHVFVLYQILLTKKCIWLILLPVIFYNKLKEFLVIYNCIIYVKWK